VVRQGTSEVGVISGKALPARVTRGGSALESKRESAATLPKGAPHEGRCIGIHRLKRRARTARAPSRYLAIAKSQGPSEGNDTDTKCLCASQVAKRRGRAKATDDVASGLAPSTHARGERIGSNKISQSEVDWVISQAG
jgi:hypothetical protein